MKIFTITTLTAILLSACSEQSLIESKEKKDNTIDVNGNRCQLLPDPGPCEALFKKYYYDQAEGQCKEFIWGGCGGVVPFDSMEECEKCKRS